PRRTGWQHCCALARCGSIVTTSSTPRSPSAATSNPGGDARWERTCWSSTRRRKRCVRSSSQKAGTFNASIRASLFIDRENAEPASCDYISPLFRLLGRKYLDFIPPILLKFLVNYFNKFDYIKSRWIQRYLRLL